MEIKVSNTNILIDIIGRHLGFTFMNNFKSYDDDFNLKRYYSFYEEKFSIQSKIKNLLNYTNSFFEFKKYDIVFSNQIRLRNQLKNIKKAKTLSDIPAKKHLKLNVDIQLIKKQMKKKIFNVKNIYT